MVTTSISKVVGTGLDVESLFIKKSHHSLPDLLRSNFAINAAYVNACSIASDWLSEGKFSSFTSITHSLEDLSNLLTRESMSTPPPYCFAYWGSCSLAFMGVGSWKKQPFSFIGCIPINAFPSAIVLLANSFSSLFSTLCSGLFSFISFDSLALSRKNFLNVFASLLLTQLNPFSLRMNPKYLSFAFSLGYNNTSSGVEDITPTLCPSNRKSYVSPLCLLTELYIERPSGFLNLLGCLFTKLLI